MLTRVGTVVGTADYLAPEAIRGRGGRRPLRSRVPDLRVRDRRTPFATKRSIVAICRAHLVGRRPIRESSGPRSRPPSRTRS